MNLVSDCLYLENVPESQKNITDHNVIDIASLRLGHGVPDHLPHVLGLQHLVLHVEKELGVLQEAHFLHVSSLLPV